MTAKIRKIGPLTWVVVLGSLVLALVMQISCSHHDKMITGSDSDDAQIAQTIEIVASVPPAVNPDAVGPDGAPILGGVLKGLGELVDTLTGTVGDLGEEIVETLLPPCGVDSTLINRLLGGVVYVSCGEQNMGELHIGANALPYDATIKIESYRLDIIGLPVREYHFSPEGLRFNSTVTLQLSAELFKEENGEYPQEILWLYFNPNTQAWSLEYEIPLAPDNYFYIPMSHFSVFRAVTKSGIGISQGGQVRPNNK